MTHDMAHGACFVHRAWCMVRVWPVDWTGRLGRLYHGQAELKDWGRGGWGVLGFNDVRKRTQVHWRHGAATCDLADHAVWPAVSSTR